MTTSPNHCLVVRAKRGDPREAALLKAAHSLGLLGLERIEIADLFFLRGELDATHLERLRVAVLSDAVSQEAVWQDEASRRSVAGAFEVTFRPGVTDTVAEDVLRITQALGLPVAQAATGKRFVLHGTLGAQDVARLARAVFFNDVIEHGVLGAIAPSFPEAGVANDRVETVRVRGLSDEALLEVSRLRRAALDLKEMQAIEAHYQGEGRDPSDLEFEMIAQTWSEHCVHKTFRARISVQGAPNNELGNDAHSINGLLKTYIRAATEKIAKPWVRSAFVDNAGVMEFDETFDLAFKVETHNHPSALEPFGGANTGVGGVIRDVLAMGAKPIAVTDVLCFGPLDQTNIPDGVLGPQRVQDGVVHGIEDYGNKMGIPTVNGAVFYHAGYTANPLVYCGCLGLMPASEKNREPLSARPNDLIVALGGRTGRDGLRGATFSSLEMDTSTSEIAGASVQIGNPITEKQVQEVILIAKHEGLYSAMTDCGAGGFSSAVGEMAKGLGAVVNLEAALLKYPGLAPWEVWLSEAQERMVLSVPPQHLARLQEIAALHSAETVVLGAFNASGVLVLQQRGHEVARIDLNFLHEGIPQKELQALGRAQLVPNATPASLEGMDPNAALLRLLAHPNIRSREEIVRRYDHEVQGATVVKPFVGVANHGPSDAAVLVPSANQTRVSVAGVVLSNGICPQFGRDAYAMAFAAIDEAVRNAVVVGADPDRIAILDNFCWGNPSLPDRLGSLVEAARGCHDAALLYGTPFISGKDSLYNEYTDANGQKHAIPGTLLISAVGVLPDAKRAVTMDFKNAGNVVYLLGETRHELGGAHVLDADGTAGAASAPMAGTVPQPVPNPLERYRALHQAIAAGLVRAAHDLSEGGLAVALAEMCIAGRVGATVASDALQQRDGVDANTALFAESAGRVVLEVTPENTQALEHIFNGVVLQRIGVVGGEALRVESLGAPVVSQPVLALETAWRGTTAQVGAPQGAANTAMPRSASTQKPKALILHAMGSNRDHDVALALRMAGATPCIAPLTELRETRALWRDYQMLVLPGGFSYADSIGAGKVWALQLQAYFGDALAEFVASGKPVIGICNGFQALVKAGVLPGNTPATLTFNQGGHFECRWVALEPVSQRSVWTRGLQSDVFCPVAHGEGNFVLEAESAALLAQNDQIALRYRGSAYPNNPNGSVMDIAGICNPQGNVLGLMPHPENHILPLQHPRQTRGEGGHLGLDLFNNGVDYAKGLGL